MFATVRKPNDVKTCISELDLKEYQKDVGKQMNQYQTICCHKNVQSHSPFSVLNSFFEL